MGKVVAASLGLFSLVIVFVVFMDIFRVLSIDEKLHQVDEFLAKRVSVHRAFTEDVENELISLLQSIELDYSDFDFTGTNTQRVNWGEDTIVKYSFKKTIIQKGMEYLGIPYLMIQPRNYIITATGR